MAERRSWPALVVRQSDDASAKVDADLVAATLDDFAPAALQDLADLPLPPGTPWDPADPSAAEPEPPLRWRIFFERRDRRDAAAAALRAAHPQLSIEPEDVPDEDWASRSQRGLAAIRVASFIVAPPWDVPGGTSPHETLIIIEPSRGFGTGHHASTRLCLRALADVDVRHHRVLDVGTGSGVLALAAALRGARRVAAVDADPDAVDSARQSAALNPGAIGIEWITGDFRDAGSPLRREPWDVVLANLTGGLLMSSAAPLRSLVHSGGALIVSGFDCQERGDVERALALPVDAAFEEDGWVGLRLNAR